VASGGGQAPLLVALLIVASLSAGCVIAGGSEPSNASHNTTKVPIKIVRDGQAALEIVPVSINGSGPYDFLLDTGSALSSVDESLAPRLHLKTTGKTTKVQGVVGSTKVDLARITNWKIGSRTLAPEKVAIVNMSKRSDGAISGLLGSDELRRFGVVTIDFQQRRLTIA
jgi:hypothetical protein